MSVRKQPIQTGLGDVYPDDYDLCLRNFHQTSFAEASDMLNNSFLPIAVIAVSLVFQQAAVAYNADEVPSPMQVSATVENATTDNTDPDETAPQNSQPVRQPEPQGPRPLSPLPEPLAKLLAKAVPLNPEKTILLDSKNKRVFLHTEVACEDCPLEMLCCTEQTKEHESILWLRGQAFIVHSALLAAGAKPGEPALFTPTFTHPWGQKINIFLNWVDKTGKLQRAPAQSWMRRSVSRYYSAPLAAPPEGITIPHQELRYDPYNKEILWYGHMSDSQRDELLALCPEETYQAAVRQFHKDSQTKPMTAEFVFAGSYHYVVDGTDKKVYAAEAGYLLCVANFADALIDVTEASSASDGGQSYEAWPGKVPPRDTPVIIELVPSDKMIPKPQPTPPEETVPPQNASDR